MITAVDTAVILDIFASDPAWGARSAALLRDCLREGSVVACEIVWAETAVNFDVEDKFIGAMSTLGITFSATNEKAALRSSQAWRQYLRRGGRRQRVVADFPVGGHALEQADRLLTRDRGFYRDYFARLKVLDPSTR